MRLTTRASRSLKRRLFIAAGLALAVGLVAPLMAPSAGAQIANPGDVRVSMHLSVFTPTFTVAGMSTMGTESATVRDNGLVTIPQSSLSFQPVEVQVNLPDPLVPGSSAPTGASSPAVVTVQAVATSDFNGGLDPSNGSAFLVGNFELLWSSSTTMNNCTVGPFRVVVRSNAQGAVAYSTSTGSTSMVDPDFSINAIPGSTAGCGGDESAINDALSLPITTPTTLPNQPAPTTTTDPTKGPPVPAVVLSLTFTPAPRAAPPQPIEHHQHPTTTAAPTTTTVAPPTFSSPPPSQNVSPPPRTNGGGGSNRPRKSVSHKVNHNPKPKDRHPKTQPKKVVKRRITPRRSVHKAARKPARPAKAPAHHKAKKVAAGAAGRQLSFVPAAFVKRSPSALATGLNLAGLLGLLVFSSLALWLVTSELSEFKAGARRQRMHRIAGVTDHR